MKRRTAKPVTKPQSVTPKRARPERAPVKLRYESMWDGVEQTSTWIHVIATWGAGNEPRIPAFQRGLIWEPKDEWLLADSIDNGFPTGTLVLWQPTYSGPTWIVDGQQRVNALGRMVRGETSIYFDCDDDHYVMTDAPDSLRHLPIADMFDWRRPSRWQRAVFNAGHDADDETHFRMSDRIHRADAASARMRDARISLIIIRKDDESFVREVFRRINTTGKPFAEEEVFEALRRESP